MSHTPSRVHEYSLLASAIAGRSLDVAPGSPDDPAWTDGSTIYIDPHADGQTQFNTLCVQAALIGAGSLAPDILSQVNSRSTARRYLTAEGHRALTSLELVLPKSVCTLIDRDMASRTDSPRDSYGLAAHRGDVGDPPPEFGTIRPRRIRRQLSDASAVEAGTRVHWPRGQMPDSLRELDDSEVDAGSAPDNASSPVGGAGPLGRLLKRLLADVRGRAKGDPGADSPTHVAPGGVTRFGSAAPTMVRPGNAGEFLLLPPRAWVYPEWDVHRHGYRSDWCTVRELEPPDSRPPALQLPDVHALRRPLARIGLERERRGRQEQGIDIDIDAAVEAYVDVAAGLMSDELLYVDLVRTRRDLAVLLLLDVSGSSAQRALSGGTVHTQQRTAAAALTTALQVLGDRVALYAFRSRGRTDVEIIPVKRFADTFGAEGARRLASCEPGGYTRLGAAIRHGAWRLEHDAGMSRRLLLVLSDGFAYDHAYEGSYGEADAARALAEARRRGTGCLCLSLGTPTDPAALRRVFGTAAHATVPRSDQLPATVGAMVRFALQSAESQRRTFNRSCRARERWRVEEGAS